MSTIRKSRRKIIEYLSQHGELTGAHLLELDPDLPRSTIYVTLARMEADGWLKSRYEKIPHERTRPRRFYKLTALGNQALKFARQQDLATGPFDPEWSLS